MSSECRALAGPWWQTGQDREHLADYTLYILWECAKTLVDGCGDGVSTLQPTCFRVSVSLQQACCTAACCTAACCIAACCTAACPPAWNDGAVPPAWSPALVTVNPAHRPPPMQASCCTGHRPVLLGTPGMPSELCTKPWGHKCVGPVASAVVLSTAVSCCTSGAPPQDRSSWEGTVHPDLELNP